MKHLLILALIFSTTACEYAFIKYGYQENPLTVLNRAAESLENNDLDSWKSVLSSESLCLYGTAEGMANVSSTLAKIDANSLNEPMILAQRHLSEPRYIGYFSYYQERYEALATDKDGHRALKVLVVCDFGRRDYNEKYIGASKSKYGVRSCRITKIRNYLNPLENTICEGL